MLRLIHTSMPFTPLSLLFQTFLRREFQPLRFISLRPCQGDFHLGNSRKAAMQEFWSKPLVLGGGSRFCGRMGFKILHHPRAGAL